MIKINKVFQEQKLPASVEKAKCDQPTDGSTDIAGYRVARTRLKDNMAVYTATEVACGWAGAVIKKAI